MDDAAYRRALMESQLKGLKSLFQDPSSEGSNVEGDIYDVSFYCPCPTCCGKNSPESGGHGLTASGQPPVEGETIAADWTVLPKGSMVEIEGLGPRKVMDKGGAIKGKRIDVFMKSHEEALKAGRRKLRVKRLENAGKK